MMNSDGLSEPTDAGRQQLLTRFKNLGLITDDQLVRMSSESPEELQKSINELQDTKKRLQDDFRQLITIKDVIEKYLSRLISDMLERKDVLESLQHAMELYPSLQFIRWLVEDEEIDLAELIRDLDLDNDYALSTLHRWKYEYKPLGDIWLELRRREDGRENNWTGVTWEDYYSERRHMPQVSIRLEAGAEIVWNAREDVDDMMMLARALFRICLRTLSRLEEHRDVHSSFIERMNTVIRETEEIINQLKALPILSAQNIPEDSPEIQ
jgi:predicted nuclease with TOPRIM domain